jgi:hypothetical protein
LKKTTNSHRKFGSDGNGNPNYGREAINLFSWKKRESMTRSWPLNWRGLFLARNKDAPLSLDFGLGLWRLHTMAVQVERPWEFMAKGLGFRLDLWKLHTYYARLKAPIPIFDWQFIFSPFLWTLNKDWPLNPMAS